MHEVNDNLNRDFFVRSAGVSNIDVRQITEITLAVIFFQTKISDKLLGVFENISVYAFIDLIHILLHYVLITCIRDLVGRHSKRATQCCHNVGIVPIIVSTISDRRLYKPCSVVVISVHWRLILPILFDEIFITSVDKIVFVYTKSVC